MHIRCIIMQVFLFAVHRAEDLEEPQCGIIFSLLTVIADKIRGDSCKVTLDNRCDLVYIDLRILFEKRIRKETE